MVRQGISSDISHASPSAAILFAGQKACIIKDKKGFSCLYREPHANLCMVLVESSGVRGKIRWWGIFASVLQASYLSC